MFSALINSLFTGPNESVHEHIKNYCPLLSVVVDEAEKEHPEIQNMLIYDAFKIIADRIGFEFNSYDSITDTLDRAEEFLGVKSEITDDDYKAVAQMREKQK